MFKKLSKKDATKFQFTVSVEDIENFVPPRKEGVSEKKGGFGFGKKKESSSTDNDVSNYSYAIFWKRGSKRSGHSEFVSYKTISSSNKLVINETFKLTGTLFQSGKKFLKKKMDFEVHEKLTSDATSNGEKIASGHIDLADFVNSESEVTSSAEVKLEGMKKGSGTIRLTVSSTCLKDGRKGDEITEVSTYTAESDDGDDATEDDGNSPRRRDKKPAVDTKLLQENEELRDQNLLLQRKIAELESTLSNDDGDSAGLISDLQKERDDLRLKLKNALIECENYKEERDRAISAQQGSDKRAFDEQVKAQTMRQKLQKQLNEVQAKSNDSSSEKELQSLKSELEISVNKLRELEQENSQFKERIEELEKASDKLKTLSDELQHDKQIAETHLKNFQAIHEEEKTIASERISAIEAQLQTTQNELIELQNKRGAERAQLNELVQQVSKLGGLISDSEAMIADESQDSEAQIKSVALNISKLTSDVNDKLSEIDKLSTEARILQEKLDNVTSDTSEQSSHIEKLEQLVSWGTKSLSEKKSGGSDRFEELKESKALADAINAVLAELEEKADTVEKLNIQIAHLNNDITDDVKESAKLRIDLDEKATAVEKLLLQVEELNSQINSKDSSIQDLQQDVAQLQKGIQEKEDEIKNLAADVEELEKLKNSQTEQIKQISNQDDDEFEELQQTNLEMKKRISELQNRIDELELESSLSVRKAQDQIEKLEITIADLRKQLDESSSSEDESDDAEKIKLQQTNARLRDRITELETDNKVLADSIAELETSVNEIKELGAHSAVLTQNSGEVIADLENKYQDLEKKYKDGLKMVKSVEAQEKETTKKLQKAQKLLDDQQVELEERDHELARLRKKLKKLESTDSSSNMQQTITQYMEEEVYPLLSQAIFKNQQQFSHADLAASRLVILKTLLNRGVVARSLLNVVTEDLDNALFNVMLDMPNLTSNDGFLVKMTISVFENFIFENLLTKDEKNDQISFFQRTRQCADICVLQQALVLHSDEMRQMVCPDLSIDEVQVICQKLGLD